MAEFYWVGGSTGTATSYNQYESTAGLTGFARLTWARAFDWNNPKNWRQKTSNSPGLGQYIVASRCPNYGDIAVFGTIQDPTSTNGLSRALTPCLFGGAQVISGATVTWIGGLSAANYTGTTFNSSLDTLLIEAETFRVTVGADASTYRWGYLGGGALTGGSAPKAILEVVTAYGPASGPLAYWNIGGSGGSGGWWSGNTAQDIQSLLNALYSGLTSSSDRNRIENIKVKTNHIQGGLDSTNGSGIYEPGITSGFVENQGIANIEVLPNYATVGSGATAMTYIRTTANLRGTPHYILSGKFLDIKRYGLWGLLSGGVGSNIPALLPTAGISGGYGYPRPHLSLRGVTAAMVELPSDNRNNIGRWYFDDKCSFGKVSMKVGNLSYLVELDGCGFNRDVTLDDLGISGGSAGSGTINENFILTMPLSGGNITPQFTGKHGVYIGRAPGSGMSPAGVTANWMSVGGSVYGTESLGTTFSVANKFYVNQLDLRSTRLQADTTYVVNKFAKINTLNLDLKSSIDFRKTPNFDNWQFGYNTGSVVNGGIIAKDEESYILGSQGVRLYNEQLISSLRIGGKRSGTKVTPASLIGQEFID